MPVKRKYFSAFDEWLHSQPVWKEVLDEIPEYAFNEMKIRRERIEKIFEKLDEYGFSKIYSEKVDN